MTARGVSRLVFAGLIALAVPTLAERATAQSADADAEAADSSTVPGWLEITFLANESFLVSAGGHSVLIDPFVRDPYLQYSAVPESALAAMTAGAPPFDNVVLALVSHAHADHHQAEVARAYFAARPEVAFVTSPQVLSQTFPEPVRANDEAVLPAPGQSLVREIGEVRVEFLGLPHGGSSGTSVENLGHVIGIGGRHVLHVGDAEPDPEVFAPLDLPSRDLDVALVPYWYLRTKNGRLFLDEHIGAEWYVACHVPPSEAAEVTARLVMRMPNLRVAGRPLETYRY